MKRIFAILLCLALAIGFAGCGGSEEPHIPTGDGLTWDEDYTGPMATRPEEKQVNLKIRVYEKDEFRFEENIRETVHEPEKICDLLQKCGFSAVKWDNRLLENSNPGTTWFVVAQKWGIR